MKIGFVSILEDQQDGKLDSGDNEGNDKNSR